MTFRYVRDKVNTNEIMFAGFKDFTGLFDTNVYEQITGSLPEGAVFVNKQSIIDGGICNLTGFLIEYYGARSISINPGTIRNDGLFAKSTNNVILSLNTNLDTGVVEPNQWYYVWLLYDVVTKSISFCFSLSNTNPTVARRMFSKLLPIAIKTDGSSNIIPFYVTNGWPHCPEILYSVTIRCVSSDPTVVLFGSVPNNGYVDVDLSNFVPPVSTVAVLATTCMSANRGVLLKARGESHEGQHLYSRDGSDNFLQIKQRTDSSQYISVAQKDSAGSFRNNTIYVGVQGFIVNKVL